MTIQPETRKWYDNDLLLVVLFIVFFPIAIYGMLKRSMESQSQARGIPSPSTSDRRVPTSDPGSDFGEDFLSISRDGFVMKDHVSPNGRFIVGSSDHHYENDRRIKGKCALFESGSNRPLFVKTINRANNAHVTDDGMVIVEDWKDENLSGALLAFDKEGNRLWAKHYKANIYTSGFSPDSSRVFVCTANSDHEPHSGKTFYLEASTGKQIWKADFWDRIDFDEDRICAVIRKDDGERLLFPFGPKGELPPGFEDAWNEHVLHIPPYVKFIDGAWDALKQKPPKIDEAKERLASVEGDVETFEPNWKARFLRFKGEIAHAEGDLETAVGLWKSALDLDPTVGIKRRYDSTIKKLGGYYE